jgi:hypothetical protein
MDLAERTSKPVFQRWLFLSFLILAFGLRFYFGLHCPSVIEDDDEVQTYLIGLKSFTTHTWPYYGTDLQGGGVAYRGQMAGALLGLLVRIPLEIWAAPESPFLFLNLLTFLAFSFLAWGCCKRNPRLSPWFVFTWIYIAPWTTHFSTLVLNQSYSIVGAIAFFMGFMESVPVLRRSLMSPGLSNALMGFGLFWVMQLHMSWVILVPFLAYSIYAQWQAGQWKGPLLFLVLGSLPMLALLLPTYWIYGVSSGNNIAGYSDFFNRNNFGQGLTILARYLSFATFELPRFLGEHTHERIAFLLNNPWLTVPGFFLWITGILQAVAMVILWFFKNRSNPDWVPVKRLALGVFLTLYLFFWFSQKSPAAIRYYEVLPVAMIYSFYCWEILCPYRFWRIFAIVFLIAGVYFQIGYALQSDHRGISVYSQYRERMAMALEKKDYHLLADRRPYAPY